MIRDWDSDFGGIGPGIGVVLELGWNCLGIGIDWGAAEAKKKGLEFTSDGDFDANNVVSR